MILFKRDIKSIFSHPLIYVISFIFSIFCSLFFIQHLATYTQQIQSLSAEQQASIDFTSGIFIPFLGSVNFILLIICPLIVGIVMNEDWENETFYHWRLAGVKNSRIILEKFFGMGAVLGFFLFIIALYSFSYFYFDQSFNLDLLMAYLALTIQGLAYIGIALFCSSFIRNLGATFFATLFCILLNLSLTWISKNIPSYYYSEIISFFSFSYHLENLSRGILSGGDLFFYFSSITCLLYFASIMLDFGMNDSFAKTKRVGHYLKEHAASFIFTILLFILSNGIFYQFNWQVDLSRNQKNSLSLKTKTILKQINKKTRILFFSHKKQWSDFSKILKLYSNESDLISFEMYDLNLDYLKAEALGVEANGIAVIEQGEKKIRVKLDSELSLTNGFFKLVRNRDSKLVFIQGHGENDLRNKDNFGYSYLRELLLEEQVPHLIWDMDSVNSPIKKGDVVVIAQPRDDFLPSEVELLKSLKKGGVSFLTLFGASLKKENLDNFKSWLQISWGIKVQDDLILDKLASVQGVEATMPLMTNFNQKHPISQGINFRVLSPFSRSFNVEDRSADRTSILSFSHPFPGSWGENSKDQLISGEVLFEEQIDSKGPLALSATVESSCSKMFFLGSSQVVANRFTSFTGGFNYLLNGIEWLLGYEDLISLERDSQRKDPLVIRAGSLKIIGLVSGFLFPFLLILFGALLFWKRKRL